MQMYIEGKSNEMQMHLNVNQMKCTDIRNVKKVKCKNT